jgi:hypothetical protein
VFFELNAHSISVSVLYSQHRKFLVNHSCTDSETFPGFLGHPLTGKTGFLFPEIARKRVLSIAFTTAHEVEIRLYVER